MAKTGLKEFKEVVTDVKSLPSLVVNAAVVAPLADFVLHLGAPWPSGVPVITSLVELITLICIFHFWFKKNQKQLRRLLIIWLILLIVSFFGYLYLFDTYTFVNPSSSKRYAKGYVVNPDVQELIPQHVKTPEEALVMIEYKEEQVWTLASITHIRLLLLFSWLLTFASLVGLIGTFVMAQRRTVVRSRVRRRSPPKATPPPPSPGV